MKKNILFLAGLLFLTFTSMAQIRQDKPLNLSDTLLYEDWSSHGFIDNQWGNFSCDSLAWSVSDSGGAPVPSVRFHYNEAINCSFSMTSKLIPGTNKCTEIRYDVYFFDSSHTPFLLSVEIFDGSMWRSMEALNGLDDSYQWKSHVVNISDYCHNDFVIRFRVDAEYYDSDYMYLDNILVGSFPLGISEHQDKDVMIRPNPARTSFSLDLKNFAGQRTRLVIMDLSGKDVYSDEFIPPANDFTRKIDISSLSKGIYFCRIMTDQKALVRKLIVE